MKSVYIVKTDISTDAYSTAEKAFHAFCDMLDSESSTKAKQNKHQNMKNLRLGREISTPRGDVKAERIRVF